MQMHYKNTIYTKLIKARLLTKGYYTTLGYEIMQMLF